MLKITADPQILRLGGDFYDEVSPARFPQGDLRYWNLSVATQLGWQDWDLEKKKDHFWAFKSLPHNLQKPLALRYHGHQFMTYNPELGDGRGFLFAQVRLEGKLFEFGTKGSGQTPYSRRGDGRLTLKGAFREALATELLESLGVNTSKTFSFFETGESLHRGDEPSPTRSAVLTRFSESHLRIGTFQRLAYLNETKNILKLVDYVLENYYPELAKSKLSPCETLFKGIVDRHAKLVAEIMLAGFVHGVLNTDNLNLTGENFDYGPYRFLPTYKPDFTAAYFDHSGLYAYSQQPRIFAWNLHQLGLALKQADPGLNIEKEVQEFGFLFSKYATAQCLQRLNLPTQGYEKDSDLMGALFQAMYDTQNPFEQTLFDFFGGKKARRWLSAPAKENYKHPSFQTFIQILESYTELENEKLTHPYFQGEKPVTLLYPEIEKIWSSIDSDDDWSAFQSKLEQFRQMRGLYLCQPRELELSSFLS